MNIFVFILIVFSMIGLIDKILNNKLGLVKAFDQGLQSMGTLALSMMGFYCIAITFVNSNVDMILNLSRSLNIDPYGIIGCLLAPDLGGHSIISGLSDSSSVVLFAGLLMTSTIGTVLSFQLPLFFTALDKEDIPSFIRGLIYGIIVVPFVLIPFGLYLGIDLFLLFPCFIICLLLILGLIFLKKQTMSFLIIFGKVIKAFSLLFFAFVVLSLYIEEISFTSVSLIEEALLIVFKCSMIVIGSMILCDLCLKYCKKIIGKAAKRLKVNEYSIMGLLLQMASSVAMFPLFSKMDTKGKIINGAFSVAGAYVFGAQLGYASSVTDSSGVILYIGAKLLAGILSIILVNIVYKKTNG